MQLWHLIVFAVVVFGEDIDFNGEIEDHNVFIQNGKKATPHQFPFMVFIRRSNYVPKDRRICSGTLIKPDMILTAYHCISEDATYEVIAGGHKVYEGEDSQQTQTVTIANFIRIGENDMDCAIIKLPKAFQLNKYVGLIELEKSFNYRVGKKFLIDGWGAFQKLQFPDALRKGAMVANLDIKKNTKHCAQIYKLKNWQYHVCLADVYEGHGTCSGDSGGPAFHKVGKKFKQVAVMIAGPNSCQNINAAFTDGIKLSVLCPFLQKAKYYDCV